MILEKVMYAYINSEQTVLALIAVKSLFEMVLTFFLTKKSDRRKLLFSLRKSKNRKKACNEEREIAPKKKLPLKKRSFYETILHYLCFSGSSNQV